MKVPLLFLGFAAALPKVKGQVTATDPDLVTLPDQGINYAGCFNDIARADRNGDGYIKRDEYLGFIQEYARKEKCLEWPELTLKQTAAFNSLACLCRSLGQPSNCCLQEKARIPTAGALNVGKRTEPQLQYLVATCKVTDGTLPPSACPPEVIARATPPPGLVTGAVAPPPPADGGLSKGAIAGIIIGAILFLLMLFACCCVCRKRRQAKLLEDEEEQEVTKTEQMEMAPEQARSVPTEDLESSPRSMFTPQDAIASMGPAAMEEVARRGIVLPDPEEDEEGRKTRGYAIADEEGDPDRRRFHAEGEIPEHVPNPEKILLKPIPPKEEDPDPEWDQPGRAIDETRDKDDMSAGEVDHYEPDGGVFIPQREPRRPISPPNVKWERKEKDEPEEYDPRKRRVQAGLGEGEVWDKLGETEEESRNKAAPQGDVFDWVVSSALGVLDNQPSSHP